MSTKVYVGNLPDNCNPSSLRDLFGSYGEISELDVIKNFAFVHFAKESDANSAVRDLDKSKMLGQEITVEISKSQRSNRGGGRREGGNRDRDRQRSSRNNMTPLMGASLGGLGGILGAAPGGPLGGLGILSAVNTLAAAAEQQQQQRRHNNEPDPDVRVRREVAHTRDVPGAAQLGLSNGYVIYERYYVDPSHPLLKGLPLPDLPRMTDTLASRDSYRCDSYDRMDSSFDNYRERSPHNDRKDYNDYDNRYFDRR